MHTNTVRMLRMAKQKRIYPGEKLSYLLIGWLNQMQDKKAPSRVFSLIEVTKKLVELNGSSDFPRASINPRKPGLIGDKTQFANWRRASKLVRQVNGLLSYHKMFPRFSRGIGSSLTVSWIKTTNKFKLNIGILAGGNYDKIQFDEGDAVASVLRLAELGYIGRLRRCKCENWFYARFSRQKFCGTPCQQRDFRKTDEFRAYRRGYMREHRMILAKLAKRRFVPKPRRD